MKIILLKDVAGVGKKYEVKDVADGFARNQLLPHGDAEIATSKALSALDAKRKSLADKKNLDSALLGKNIEELANKTVILMRKANEKGHLFAKIKTQEIALAIHEQLRVEIPVSLLILKEPIESVGPHAISLNGGGVSATFTLDIQV